MVSDQEQNEIAILECMIHLELCWRIFSVRDHASIGKSVWDKLYEETGPQSLRNFALRHGRPDQKEITSDRLQSATMGQLKYFLQTSQALLKGNQGYNDFFNL